MSESAFTTEKTETLLTIRKNLLDGLTKVAESLENGTFNTPGEKGAAPPSQSGQLTLAMLLEVQAVLTERGHPLTW